jgi:DNA-binding IclR family transcriptional regulator
VERALAILSAFDRDHARMTLTEVAQRTGLDTATALRLIRTLSASDFLQRLPNGSYGLTAKILSLSSVYLEQFDVREQSIHIMRRIRDELDETVLLSVPSQGACVYVEKAQGQKEFSGIGRLGRSDPLYCGAAARVLLSNMAPSDIENYLSLTKFEALSENTMTDPEQLRRSVEETLKNGYAESINERGTGGAAVASVIRDHTGQVVAALSVSTPLSRWTSVRERAIELTVNGTHEISMAIGWQSPAQGSQSAS